MTDGVLSTIRHFPEHRATIEALSLRDAEFLSLCDDLWDAEQTLLMWKCSSSTERCKRVAEYEELVWELTSEIGTILKTVSIGPGSKGCAPPR
jgi:hypothetical protein